MKKCPIEGEGALEEVLSGAWSRIDEDARLDNFSKGWQLARILAILAPQE
jgi:hypothetical protein